MRVDLDDAVIRNYLLGLLTESEAEALEEAYLADPEAWERVRGVEDDLLDDYAGGRLASGERRLFERKYLASPPLRDRVVAARALRQEAVRGKPPARRPARWSLPLAVAAAVLLALAAVWRQTPRPPTIATIASPSPILPTAEPRIEEPSPSPAVTVPITPSPEPAVSSVLLALSPVLLRGEARPPLLRVPPGAQTVVFELEGDPAVIPPPSSSLAASVETVEGGPVWSGDARRAAPGDRPSLLAVARVPAAGLAPGDYIVTLSADAPGAILHRYFVRVAR